MGVYMPNFGPMFPGAGDRGGGSNPIPGMSSNQFFNPLPPSPTTTSPGIVPSASAGTAVNQTGLQTQANKLDDFMFQQPIDPSLTQALMQYLSGELGKGATPFNLSTALPSGGTTAPGALSAPANPVLQQLMDFFTKGGSGGPGSGTLIEMSKTGLPTDVMPVWESMIEAQKRNIEQGAAQLRGQSATSGGLQGSPFAQALADYYNQSTLSQNALLGQMTLQSQEAAKGRQLSSSEILQSAQTQLGQIFQGMDQQAINNLLAEFIRTRPEYGPLLNMIFGAGTSYSPVLSQKYGIGSTGAILGAAGSAAGGIADIINVLRGKG